MEVCWWKNPSWIAEDIKLAVGVKNHHIVVDVEVRIVVVLVFPGDEQNALVRKRFDRRLAPGLRREVGCGWALLAASHALARRAVNQKKISRFPKSRKPLERLIEFQTDWTSPGGWSSAGFLPR